MFWVLDHNHNYSKLHQDSNIKVISLYLKHSGKNVFFFFFSSIFDKALLYSLSKTRFLQYLAQGKQNNIDFCKKIFLVQHIRYYVAEMN